MAPEMLFNTSLIGRDGDSIQNLVLTAIDKCEIDSRKSLSKNIILAGGTTLFRGFPERL